MSETPNPKPQQIHVAVELTSGEPPDQPVLANYATASIVHGLAYLDFGFIEPAVLAALAQAAQQGEPLPKTLRGRRTVRVAVGLDVLQQLQQQLAQIMANLRNQQPTTS